MKQSAEWLICVTLHRGAVESKSFVRMGQSKASQNDDDKLLHSGRNNGRVIISAAAPHNYQWCANTSSSMEPSSIVRMRWVWCWWRKMMMCVCKSDCVRLRLKLSSAGLEQRMRTLIFLCTYHLHPSHPLALAVGRCTKERRVKDSECQWLASRGRSGI